MIGAAMVAFASVAGWVTVLVLVLVGDWAVLHAGLAGGSVVAIGVPAGLAVDVWQVAGRASITRRMLPSGSVVSRSFAGDCRAPGAVRGFVSATLERSARDPEVIAVACLLASELVTNAIDYAGSAPSVEIEIDPDRLVVSVWDQRPDLPPRIIRVEDPYVTYGHGLIIVAAASQAWGHEVIGKRKRVWFELCTAEEVPPS